MSFRRRVATRLTQTPKPPHAQPPMMSHSRVGARSAAQAARRGDTEPIRPWPWRHGTGGAANCASGHPEGRAAGGGGPNGLAKRTNAISPRPSIDGYGTVYALGHEDTMTAGPRSGGRSTHMTGPCRRHPHWRPQASSFLERPMPPGRLNRLDVYPPDALHYPSRSPPRGQSALRRGAQTGSRSPRQVGATADCGT